MAGLENTKNKGKWEGYKLGRPNSPMTCSMLITLAQLAESPSHSYHFPVNILLAFFLYYHSRLLSEILDRLHDMVCVMFTPAPLAPYPLKNLYSRRTWEHRSLGPYPRLFGSDQHALHRSELVHVRLSDVTRCLQQNVRLTRQPQTARQPRQCWKIPRITEAFIQFFSVLDLRDRQQMRRKAKRRLYRLHRIFPDSNTSTAFWAH